MMMSSQSSDKSDKPSKEAEAWADSCLEFNDDDSCSNQSKEPLDVLTKQDSNFGEKSGDEKLLLSPSSASKHASPDAQQLPYSDELFLSPSSGSKHASPAAQLSPSSDELFLSPSSESKHASPAAQLSSSSDELFLSSSSESKHASPAAQLSSSSDELFLSSLLESMHVSPVTQQPPSIDELFSPPSSESKHASPAAQQPPSSVESFLSSFLESMRVSTVAHQPSSSDKQLTQSGPETDVGFNYEKTDDATRIRYKGEEYVLPTGSVATEKDEDPDLVELGKTAELENVESEEQIFKVWDLGTLEVEEEYQLTSELKKGLRENYLEKSHTRKSTEDSTAALNTDELDDLITGITDLSLDETPSSPPHSPPRRTTTP